VPFGSDFQYTNAAINYENMDKVRETPCRPSSWANLRLAANRRNAWANLHLLGQSNTFLSLQLMAYMNANAAKYGMRLHYSTPTFYMKTLHAKDHEWPLKVDDFETYAIGPDQFLVGCDPSPGVTLSFYTVTDCHWLPSTQ
jgi:hypothetical protein